MRNALAVSSARPPNELLKIGRAEPHHSDLSQWRRQTYWPPIDFGPRLDKLRTGVVVSLLRLAATSLHRYRIDVPHVDVTGAREQGVPT